MVHRQVIAALLRWFPLVLDRELSASENTTSVIHRDWMVSDWGVASDNNTDVEATSPRGDGLNEDSISHIDLGFGLFTGPPTMI